MLLNAVVAALAMGTAGPQDSFPDPKYFVFLVTGKNPPKATSEEITEYQRAHIDNFKRLFGERKLSTAGPMADPTKLKRGIVVLTVDKPADVMKSFEPDPYVSKGFMDVQAHRIKVEFGKINTSGIAPEGIEENRIVIYERGTLVPDSPELKVANRRHEAHIKTEGPKVGLAFFATVSANTGELRAIALFKGKDDAAIQAWIDADPLVKMGTLKATKMPQYLSKGVLGQ